MRNDRRPEQPDDDAAGEPEGPAGGMDEALAGIPKAVDDTDPSGAKDIASALRGWDYESGTINVRKIRGRDGHPKLQMRLDLGLLQMEMAGRPDGARPHGCESLLEFHERELTEYSKANGGDLDYHLTGEQCQALREEAVMYYHRYLSLFVLEDFTGVVRDTARNLRVLDLCGRFAVEEQDRLVLEQYRPYIVMMNARAQASLLFKDKKFAEALATVDGGLGRIREFFKRFGQEEAFAASHEVKLLKRFAREIRRKMPGDPLRRLRTQLDKAVRDERYEDAARLRDQIESQRRTQDSV